MFFKIGVFKNFTVVTKKHLWWNLLRIKLKTWRPATWYKRLQRRRFRANTKKFLKIAFLWNTSDGCFTSIIYCEHLHYKHVNVFSQFGTGSWTKITFDFMFLISRNLVKTSLVWQLKRDLVLINLTKTLVTSSFVTVLVLKFGHEQPTW